MNCRLVFPGVNLSVCFTELYICMIRRGIAELEIIATVRFKLDEAAKLLRSTYDR
jgi:hypothetical protein